ncbi:hypothetical protein GDO86_009682 [Hymenochirus boettgeri]|uniref:Solute carrier family 2, facilitated glucose transporter member 12 n=1 Tax=Hymenochirus boettgeri TaxID=247094 RepID=A0A8T2JJY7_9PIPI|nr:hypothetical protein GDO86_009682 [Hymenochirus boettgeri]
MLEENNIEDLIPQEQRHNEELHTAPRQAGCGTFIILSSVIAAVSGLLVGYELGIISGALLQLNIYLALTCQQQEIIVSSLLIGALVASLAGGFLIDLYGRRIAIIFTSCLLVIANILPIIFASYGTLIAGRIATGVSISLSAIATCVYIAEISPHHKRGMLVSLNELMIVVGFLLAYICNYLFASVSSGWKYMFGLIIPLAALQAAAMYFLPRSPRFLIMKGQDAAAEKVLQKLRASSDISEELNVIKSSIKAQCQYQFFDLFGSRDNMRARLLIGLTLNFFVQITGQPNILFYASTVLKAVGFQSTEAASLASTGIGAVKVISTIPAILFVDKVGSKNFLCAGSVVMAMSLLAMGLVSLKLDVNFDNICKHQNVSLDGSLINGPVAIIKPNGTFLQGPESFQSTPPSYLTSSINDNKLWNLTVQASKEIESQPDVPAYMKWLCLASLLAFVAAFSIGLGPMVWLIQSEIFPAGIKGRAFAITSSMNWGMNLIISLTFLTLTEIIGLPWMLFGYCVMSIASLAFVIMFVPKTKGRQLEEISMELANKKYTCNADWCNRRARNKLSPVEMAQNPP